MLMWYGNLVAKTSFTNTQLSGIFGHYAGIILYIYVELQSAIQRCSRQVRNGLALPAELATLQFCTTHICSLNALSEASVPHLGFQFAHNVVTNNLSFGILLLSCHINKQYCCHVSKQGALETEKFQRLFKRRNSGYFLSCSGL